MREDANRPLFSAESTAVRITAFMRCAAAGICSCCRALTYGCAIPGLFQGRSVTTTRIEPT
jgi:hypothetical protein